MSGSGTVLAFDYGSRRIGVAVGQCLGHSARALSTVQAGPGGPDWVQIAGLIADWEPEALVVGLPWHLDGSPHDLAPRILRFSRQLHGRFRCPVYTVDERLSSHEAAARLRAGLQGGLDAVAAQVILETWWSMQDGARSSAGGKA